jgi:hypothetical protein
MSFVCKYFIDHRFFSTCIRASVKRSTSQCPKRLWTSSSCCKLWPSCNTYLILVLLYSKTHNRVIVFCADFDRNKCEPVSVYIILIILISNWVSPLYNYKIVILIKTFIDAICVCVCVCLCVCLSVCLSVWFSVCSDVFVRDAMWQAEKSKLNLFILPPFN